MTCLIKIDKQTYIVGKKQAINMASIIWDTTVQDAETKINALELLPSVSTTQTLKIA